MNNIPLYAYTIFYLSFHPLMDPKDCFHLLATVNNAVVNMSIQISLQDSASNFFEYISKSEIAGSYANFIFKFLRNYHIVVHNVKPLF